VAKKSVFQLLHPDFQRTRTPKSNPANAPQPRPRPAAALAEMRCEEMRHDATRHSRQTLLPARHRTYTIHEISIPKPYSLCHRNQDNLTKTCRFRASL